MQDKKKKSKKQSKIRDLKPKKDTKGGTKIDFQPAGPTGTRGPKPDSLGFIKL
jgi:hypothetical protein